MAARGGDAALAPRTRSREARGAATSRSSRDARRRCSPTAPRCEKLLRRFRPARAATVDAIALLDAGAEGRFGLRALGPKEAGRRCRRTPSFWRRTAELALPGGLRFDRAEPGRLDPGAAAQPARGPEVEWRHFPGPAGTESGPPARAAHRCPPIRSAPGPLRFQRRGAQALLPAPASTACRRWDDVPSWVPASRRSRSATARATASAASPPTRAGPARLRPRADLGAPRSFSSQGMTECCASAIATRRARPRRGTASCRPRGETIGYVELARLPQIDVLALGLPPGRPASRFSSPCPTTRCSARST